MQGQRCLVLSRPLDVFPSASPGLFSWGLPAGSSLAGFSAVVSFFSWVELRRPRRPGETRSAGDGSAPDGEELLNCGISFIHSFFPPFFLKPHSQWIWYPGGRSLMLAREILPLSPSSNSTITLPSFSSSPGPPKTHNTTEDVSCQEMYRCAHAECGCWCVALTSMDVSGVETARALAPVGTHSRPCSQDGLGLGPHV